MLRQPIIPPSRVLLACVAATIMCGVAQASIVNVASPTTGWRAIRYGGANGFDPTVDQQTGSAEGDIVGNSLHASVYTSFGDANTPSKTDGTLAFRLRLGADSNPTGFKTAAFVGIITNPASGKIDLFIGVNNSGSADTIGIYAPGAGLNTSPSTTTMGSTPLVSYTPGSANYNWSAVSSTIDPTVGSDIDLDGGGLPDGNDYFLTFAIPFSDIVAQLAAKGITGINENSTFSYVIATATQANSLNQDLNGVLGGVNSSSTWASLGAIADPTTPISAVPEVNPTVFVFLLLAAAIAHRQWQQRVKPIALRVRSKATREPVR